MAYVPQFEYAHADDFSWDREAKFKWESSLSRKLRACTKLSIFFGKQELPAGRSIDTDVPAALNGKDCFLLKQNAATVPADFGGAPYHECDLADLGTARENLQKEILAWAEGSGIEGVPKIVDMESPGWPPVV
jgi:hypothetical protein